MAEGASSSKSSKKKAKTPKDKIKLNVASDTPLLALPPPETRDSEAALPSFFTPPPKQHGEGAYKALPSTAPIASPAGGPPAKRIRMRVHVEEARSGDQAPFVALLRGPSAIAFAAGGNHVRVEERVTAGATRGMRDSTDDEDEEESEEDGEDEGGEGEAKGDGFGSPIHSENPGASVNGYPTGGGMPTMKVMQGPQQSKAGKGGDMLVGESDSAWHFSTSSGVNTDGGGSAAPIAASSQQLLLAVRRKSDPGHLHLFPVAGNKVSGGGETGREVSCRGERERSNEAGGGKQRERAGRKD